MPRREIDWPTLRKLIDKLADKRKLSGEYLRRLKFELKEIDKQGANTYWIELFNQGHKYDTNDNGLVLPWLLGMTKVDPLDNDHKIERSTDLPDIDVDCLPEARDKIKAYAAEKYGKDYVCSVGTWLTYKFKSALQDACRGLDEDIKEVMILTKSLPDDVDNLKDGGYAKCSSCGYAHKQVICPECGSGDTEGVTIGQLINEYEQLKVYANNYPNVVDYAVRMVGRIKAMGKHAGGIIITNRRLMGNVPMSLSKSSNGNTQWTSMWTEGRNTQLSKLGYVKWDLLGLKTLQYIHEACLLAAETRGVKFNAIPWKDNDPEKNCVGWYFDEKGERQEVRMDDPEVFQMINDLRVETLFQFETDVQRSVLSNGVRDYYDLQVFNAMGHPGPIACIGPHSKIDTEDGPKTPKELGNEKIAFLDKDGKKAYTDKFKLVRTGYKKLLKIKTREGRTLFVTSDHKIRTNNGYVQAGALEVGSKITKLCKESSQDS